MHTIMNKAQSMRFDAYIPQSWWEFAVMHATHVYNRTPMHHLKWDTPYTLLNGEVPNISHLKVFGCGAYVHISKKMHTNGLAPKSKLMAYLDHTEGIKVFKFMCLSNNTLYYSTTTLFDETLFLKCSTWGKKRGTTWIGKLRASQPPIEPVKDTTPGDNDLPTPHTPK
jgi:hypothetical protein